jgi:hypothetical protein
MSKQLGTSDKEKRRWRNNPIAYRKEGYHFGTDFNEPSPPTSALHRRIQPATTAPPASKGKKIRAALDVTARPKERKKKKEIQETPPQS